MSLFAKTGPWVVASLVAAASVFGQNSKCAPAQKSFDQGHEMMQSQMMAGYNAPARIEVRGSWDVYASGSFTYWQPIQENMELGIVSDESAAAGSFDMNGHVVNMNFNYQPGFKVGLGMNFDHDNWDTFLQYTWFRGSHSTTTSLDSVASPLTVLYATWGTPNTGDPEYFHGSQKWKLHMDLLDWQLARSCYVGTKLSFRPFCAVRAAWIRQNMDVDYSQARLSDAILSKDINAKSHSWAIGPRTGLETNWMIGEGFRLFGNAAGDILFTQYTKLSFFDRDVLDDGTTDNQFFVEQHNLNTLRTHLELELGLAWGSYFDNNNWHVDLSAGYGFQVFYDQNMFRHFNDGTMEANSMSPNGNLYMHGLTATARFDF